MNKLSSTIGTEAPATKPTQSELEQAHKAIESFLEERHEHLKNVQGVILEYPNSLEEVEQWDIFHSLGLGNIVDTLPYLPTHEEVRSFLYRPGFDRLNVFVSEEPFFDKGSLDLRGVLNLYYEALMPVMFIHAGTVAESGRIYEPDELWLKLLPAFAKERASRFPEGERFYYMKYNHDGFFSGKSRIADGFQERAVDPKHCLIEIVTQRRQMEEVTPEFKNFLESIGDNPNNTLVIQSLANMGTASACSDVLNAIRLNGNHLHIVDYDVRLGKDFDQTQLVDLLWKVNEVYYPLSNQFNAIYQTELNQGLKIRKDLDEQVKELRDTGLGRAAIAKELDMSVSSIAKSLKRIKDREEATMPVTLTPRRRWFG